MADSTVYSTAINPGAPPLRWDNVYEAFRQVNANFEMIEAALGMGGITPINFNDLDSGVSPADTNTFTLGTITKQWKRVHTAEYVNVLGSELNGLWAGNAHIKGIGATVNLPANSTIGGDPLTGIGVELIIDPAKVWFNEIQIDNNESILATSVNDSFGILSGNGISLSVDSSAETLTITNTGILDVTAGAGISRTIVAGTANIVNTGVLTLANTGGIGTRTSGLGINVSSAAGNPVITNTGVISVSSGVGITVSLDAVTGDVTVSNSAPAVNAFAQIEVNGDSANRLQADAVSDVLNIVSGYAISLSKTVATDTLTIAVDPEHDIVGSVFGDDSSLLVDAVDKKIYAGNGFFGNLTGNVTGNLSGNVTGNLSGGTINTTQLRTLESSITLGDTAGSANYTIGIGYSAGRTGRGDLSIAIGTQAGDTNQGQGAVALGRDAGYSGQGTNTVAIGFEAGVSNQGNNAIAIGYRAGYNNQTSGSIVLNASGTSLNGAAAGFYVNPIRLGGSGRALMTDTVTKEVYYSNIELLANTISTNDSSGLTVDVQTTFNTDVVFENDISVAERLTLKGSRVINLSELKSVVAASSSFADFQTKIAAMV